MSDAYVGEVRPFCGTYVPEGWLLCNGQYISINQYSTLFAVISNVYGGDGFSEFAVPNLSTRAAMGTGQGPNLTNRWLGEMPGHTSKPITAQNLPAHTHGMNAKAEAGITDIPNTDTILAQAQKTSGPPVQRPRDMYSPNAPQFQMNGDAIEKAGDTQIIQRDNHQPSLVCFYIINWDGIWPSHP